MLNKMHSVADDCGVDNKFEFPESWENDVRMGALFAPFRSKNLNPNDWSSKMKFWTSLIENWCKHQKRPLIDISQLKKQFSRKGVEPACLDEVLVNLYSANTIVLKEDFVQPNDSWKEWMVKNLVTTPLKWTFNRVKNVLVGKNVEKPLEYVHLPVVKHLGESLLREIPVESKGKLIVLEDLMKLGKIKDEECLLIILLWLNKQGWIGIREENNHTLIKIPENRKKPIIISETDIGICNLEKQKKALELNIERLEREKMIALDETKKHLSSNMKTLAKRSLRKKKEIEKTIDKRVGALENIQGLLHRIDEVKLDGDVVECYRTGIATLKTVLKETGLSQVSVASTMDELEEVLREGSDVSESLARPLDSFEDRSLEDELNHLLLKELPDVPQHEIDISGSDKDKDETEKKEPEVQELKISMEALSI